MKWFEGTIPAAIQQSKHNRSVFIVYIAGQDEASGHQNDTWNNTEVSDLCERHRCVALRLLANSDDCAQFSMIYPVVCVPSTFFIGENGVPLEVTGGHMEPEAFINKINSVVKSHENQLNKAQSASAQGAAPSASTQGAAPSELVAPQDTGQTTEGDMATGGPSKPLDERVAVAKSIVLSKQEEKAAKEKEEEKRKEQERRQQGQDVVKLKQWQKDQKHKEEVNEWKKEKEEQRLEKERVMKAIARDREEKKKRFAAEKSDRERSQAASKRVKLEAETVAKAEADAVKMEHARLQFRLPDGSAIVHQFSSQGTLQMAHDFLSEHIGSRFGSFQLTTTFPRRRFEQEHMSRTLMDLELAPSAVIVVLPSSAGSVSKQGGGGGGLFMTLFAPLLALWHFLGGFIFGAPAQPRGTHNPDQSAGDQSAARTEPRGRERPSSSYGLRRRQEGNITRLSAVQDDDDDSNTWNGNSTQQM